MPQEGNFLSEPNYLSYILSLHTYIKILLCYHNCGKCMLLSKKSLGILSQSGNRWNHTSETLSIWWWHRPLFKQCNTLRDQILSSKNSSLLNGIEIFPERVSFFAICTKKLYFKQKVYKIYAQNCLTKVQFPGFR